MNYPPPWQDMSTLCEHICVSPRTVETWVKDGTLPPGRKRGGKLMWKWDEVDAWLTRGKEDASSDPEAERIKNATRQAAAEGRTGH